MPNEDAVPTPDVKSFAPRLYGIAVLVAAIVLVGVALIARFTALDLARDMQTWQEKLNLIAESRSTEVNRWVATNFQDLRSLADNPSLQLYMTELQTMPASELKRNSSEEPSQKSYLRNLLVFTAERAGFSSNVSPINANVEQDSKSGLAVLSNDNRLLVSTTMGASTRDSMLDHATKTENGKEGLIDIQKSKDGSLYMGFIVPIYAIQGERNASAQIAKVVGIKTVDEKLFSLLKHPGTTEKTLETVLVRTVDDKIEFLSPLQDGATAMAKQINKEPKFAEPELMQTIGGFVSEKKDYRDKPVLATSRPIAGTPWTMIVKIDRSEALDAGTERRGSMVVFFFLIISIIVLIVVAVWKHAHSQRAMFMSQHFRRMAAQSLAQEQLLRLVTDNQPEPIYIVDAALICRFANRKAAEEAGMSPEHLPGKSISDIRGSAYAEQVADQCKKALTLRQITFDETTAQGDLGEVILRSAYVPLDHIPIVDLPEGTPGVLVVEQDITESVHERERRLTTQRQLVEMLVKIVDKRDPFAANHSQLVSQVAFEVATDMELDNVTVETTRTAASLMNIGKIVVAPELLTKTDKLTSEEKIIIRDSMNAAADMVRDVSFDGPVAETLRQWQEKWDGTGPLGLSGESILLTSRIIAVANAFIGMISPRSWRTAMPIEQANKFLLEQADIQFDRRVVIALVNYVDNHHGKAWIEEILENQRNAA